MSFSSLHFKVLHSVSILSYTYTPTAQSLYTPLLEASEFSAVWLGTFPPQFCLDDGTPSRVCCLFTFLAAMKLTAVKFEDCFCV